MKKIILLAIMINVSYLSFGQFTVNQSPYFSTNVIHSNYATINSERATMQGGYFGAGTHYSRAVFSSNIYWDTINELWKNTSNSIYRDFGMIRFQNGSEIGFFVSDPSATSNTPVEMTNAEMEHNRVMILKRNKRVGIGSNNPDEKLTVKGTIHCEEVKVDLSVPADYVFEKYYTGESALKRDYVMPTLEEVEAYTKENNHLPEMPSAQEIKDNGLQLKEMTNLLLQKVEELTLYTIEQEKRIKALEAKLATANN